MGAELVGMALGQVLAERGPDWLGEWKRQREAKKQGTAAYREQAAAILKAGPAKKRSKAAEDLEVAQTGELLAAEEAEDVADDKRGGEGVLTGKRHDEATTRAKGRLGMLLQKRAQTEEASRQKHLADLEAQGRKKLLAFGIQQPEVERKAEMATETGEAIVGGVSAALGAKAVAGAGRASGVEQVVSPSGVNYKPGTGMTDLPL